MLNESKRSNELSQSTSITSNLVKSEAVARIEASTLEGVRESMQGSIDKVLRQEGISIFKTKTKLLRPLISGILADELSLSLALSVSTNKNFLRAVAAMQVSHEALLFHDDVIDEGQYWQGEMTSSIQSGNRHAILEGDRFIATALRLIVDCGLPLLIKDFTQTTGNIIKGEILQNEACGKLISWDLYQEINQLKTGELFAFGGRLPYYFCHANNMEGMSALILDIGTLYQYIKDSFDYDLFGIRGKPPYQDFHSQKWTLPLRGVDGFSWDFSVEDFWRASYKVEVEVEIIAQTSSPPKVSEQALLEESRQSSAAYVLHSPFAAAIDYCLDEIKRLRPRVEAAFNQIFLLDNLLTRWEYQLIAGRQKEEEVLAGHIWASLAAGRDPNDSLPAFLQSFLEKKSPPSPFREGSLPFV